MIRRDVNLQVKNPRSLGSLCFFNIKGFEKRNFQDGLFHDPQGCEPASQKPFSSLRELGLFYK